jgi:hypothetical protein
MIWYGIEPAVAADPLKGVELIATAKHPTLRRLVARRITELIESHPAATDALVTLLTQSPEATPDILTGMSAALEGWSQAPKPQSWDTFLRSVVPPLGGPPPNAEGAPPVKQTLLSASNPNAEGALQIEKLNLIFGSGRPPEELLALITIDNDALTRDAAKDDFGTYAMSVRARLDIRVQGLLRSKVREAVIDARLKSNNEDPAAVRTLMRFDAPDVETWTAQGATSSGEMAQMFVPMGFMILLWISTFTGGQFLLTSTI